MNSHQAKAAAAYRAASLENAPPLKIVVMLYEGAIRFLERASRMDPRSDSAEFVNLLSRADRIICELRFSLDSGPSPEIAKGLEELYLFCEDQITVAMQERSIEPIPGCIDVLSRVLEGWRGIETSSGVKAA